MFCIQSAVLQFKHTELQSKKHAEREKNTLACVFLKGSVGRLKSSDKFNTAEKHEVTVYTFVRIHF